MVEEPDEPYVLICFLQISNGNYYINRTVNILHVIHVIIVFDNIEYYYENTHHIYFAVCTFTV